MVQVFGSSGVLLEAGTCGWSNSFETERQGRQRQSENDDGIGCGQEQPLGGGGERVWLLCSRVLYVLVVTPRYFAGSDQVLPDYEGFFNGRTNPDKTGASC